MVDMDFGTRMYYTNTSKSKLARWCQIFKTNQKEELEKAIGSDLMSNKTKGKLMDEVDKYSTDEEGIQLYSKYTKAEIEHRSLLAYNKEIEEKNSILEKKGHQLEEQNDKLEDKNNKLEETKNKLEIQLKNSQKETAINFYKNGVAKEIIMASLKITETELNRYLSEI